MRSLLMVLSLLVLMSFAFIGEFAQANEVNVTVYHESWCGWCRRLDQTLTAESGKRTLIVVDGLSTPVRWIQASSAAGLAAKVSALPTTDVFTADGKRTARIRGFSMEQLRAAIRDARKGKAEVEQPAKGRARPGSLAGGPELGKVVASEDGRFFAMFPEERDPSAPHIPRSGCYETDAKGNKLDDVLREPELCGY